MVYYPEGVPYKQSGILTTDFTRRRLIHVSARERAAKRGAAKLYISAHSAIESQAFYTAMGCVEAQVYNQRHVEAEPYDCQLECRL